MSESKVKYKGQRIVSSTFKDVGLEVLISSQSINEILRSSYTREAVDFTTLDDILLSRLGMSVASGTYQDVFEIPNIFINIERKTICNNLVLEQIVKLKDDLKSKGYGLIVEITERNYCGRCEGTRVALEYLKHKGVTLAIDDLDIYQGDPRFNEVRSGYYDYIKIPAPTQCKHWKVLESFIRYRKEKIILENVESDSTLERASPLLNLLWGIQGFYFDKGQPIEL